MFVKRYKNDMMVFAYADPYYSSFHLCMNSWTAQQ